MLVVRRFMLGALWMRAGFWFQRRIALGTLALLLALVAPQAFAKPCTVNVSTQASPSKTIYEFNATDNATCDNGLGYGNYWGIADSSAGFANNGSEDTYVTTTQGGRLYIFSGVIPGSSNTGILQSGFIYYPPAGFSGTDTGTFYTQNTAGGPWLNNGIVVLNVPAGANQPTVTGVSPASGTTAGGTLITITGTNFSGTNAVSVGGSSASAVTVVSGTSITAVTPAGAGGAADVRVTTPNGTSPINASAKFTYVAPTPPIAGPSSLSVAYGSSANPITLALTGGAATQINLVSPASHGTLNVTGANVTYTPITGYAGPDSFIYTAQNGAGTSSPATVTITVGTPTITYAPGNPAMASAGNAYSASVAGMSGGTAPYSHTIVSGSLPPGLTLNTNGMITGTPRAVGSFQFQVRATDASTGTGPFSSTSGTLVLNVGAPTLSMSLPPGAISGTVGTAFSQAFTASGGNSPYTYAFSVTSGTLPAGLSFNTATGELSGTPSSISTASFNVTATDSTTGGTFSVIAGYTLTVAAPTLTVNPTSLTNPRAGVAYSQTLTASGGTAPYTYAVTAGALPAGISLNPLTGYVSGTPTVAGTVNVTIQATDNNGFTSSRPYTLNVGAPTLSLLPTTIGSGVAGAAFNQTFTTSGGTGPYTYSVTGTLPAGLTLSTAGVLSGTPTATGSFPISITATDSTSGLGPFSITLNYTLTIVAGGVIVAPGALPSPVLGVAYSQTVTASGGIGPYTYTISAGALPAGLTLSSAGVVSGTPTVGGTFIFTVRAADSTTGGGPAVGTQVYTFTITPPAISLTPATLLAPTIGALYSQTVTASGGIGPYTFTVASGSLPAGLALSPAGVLSGTATAAGASSFTIRATDSSGGAYSGTQAYVFTIGGPTITLNPATLPDPAVGIAYSQTLTAAGGIAPYTFRVSSGTLPAGLTLNAATGTLSGTPTAMGASTFKITARDSSTGTGAPFDATRTFNVNTTQTVPTAPPVSATTGSNAPVTINAAASATNGPFTGVSIVSPPATGTARVEGLNIIYTPAATSAGVVTFAYALQNSAGASAPVQVSITVTPIPMPASQKQAVTAAGKEVVIDITDGATGGPFTGAAILSVSPPNAGSAVLTAAAPKQTASVQGSSNQLSVGQNYTVTFAPAAAFAGTAVVTYTISNASATSAPAALQISVTARRDPSTDPDVSGLINAQIQAARRFATAQISNYNQRLERLHANGRAAFTNNLTVVMPSAAGSSQQCQDMQSLSARDMCQRGVVTQTSRNNQRGGSGFGANGLAATHSVTSTATSTATGTDGATATAAGSTEAAPASSGNATPERVLGNLAAGTLLAALPGSPDGFGSGIAGVPDLPGADTAGADTNDARLAFWTAGSVDFGFANVGTQRSGFRFTTGGVTMGADYRVSDQLTVGAGLGYGRDGTDIGSSGTHSSADAYSVALYGSYRPTPSYFIDGVAGAGLLRFDSRRWVTDEAAFANGQRDGHQLFASLSAGYEHRSDQWLFSPYARMLVAESKLDPFSESGAGLGALTYFGQTVTTVSGALGMRTEFARQTRYGVFLPFARVEYQHDFEGQSAANLAYADLASAGPAYTVYGTPFGRDRIQVGLGAKLRTKTLTFGLDYNVMFGMSGLQQGVRMTFTAPF